MLKLNCFAVKEEKDFAILKMLPILWYFLCRVYNFRIDYQPEGRSGKLATIKVRRPTFLVLALCQSEMGFTLTNG